ncbi:polysaccharide deacetylase family protein [Candidatus Kaiserbacteria bacterium]|nr:polysaccharide deacetylase family protein [Candidatus Kaiserbacteria bacterium]
MNIPSIIKKSTTSILGSFACTSISLALSNGMPLVVMYHGVKCGTKQKGSENYRWKHIPDSVFEEQIIWLKKHFEVVSLEEVENSISDKRDIKKPLCAITFDDGFRNNYTNAFPILKKYSVPATIFLTTGFIERNIHLWTDVLEYALNTSLHNEIIISIDGKEKSFHISNTTEKIHSDSILRNYMKKISNDSREELLKEILTATSVSKDTMYEEFSDYAPLSWEEVIEMKNENITFGAHTVTHPILSSLPKDIQEDEIISSIKRICDKVGDCKYFAYPNGQLHDINNDTREILKENNIKYAWSTIPERIKKTNADDLLFLPRVTLDASQFNNRFYALTSNALQYTKNIL